MDIPVPTYIYRMIHIDNLARILAEGYINAPNSSTDAAYIPIGETSLILQRGDKQINIEPFGTFKDYVSFYFGPRSPHVILHTKWLRCSTIISGKNYLPCKLN